MSNKKYHRRPAPPPVPEPPETGMSRRALIVGGTGLLIAGAVGKAAYDRMRAQPSEDKPATESQSSSPAADSPHLTLEEAAALYNDYYQRVSQAARGAREQGKPFSILVGETHNNITAAGVEVMLFHIAKSLRIEQALLEYRPAEAALFEEYMRKGAEAQGLQSINRLTTESLRRLEMKQRGIDDRYPSLEDINREVSVKTINTANTRLRKELGFREDLIMSLNAHAGQQDIAGQAMGEMVLNNPGAFQALPEAVQRRAMGIIQECTHEAIDVYARERNKNMTAHVVKAKGSITVVGSYHLQALAEAAQKTGQESLAFAVIEKSPSRTVPPTSQDIWASTSSDVIRYEGKPFPPESTLEFVEAAIALAHEKYKTPIPSQIRTRTGISR